MAINGTTHCEDPLFHLQRTVGNPALRILQTNGEELKAGLTGTASGRFGHDFSRLPVHAQAPMTMQTKLAVSTPGDICEQEADNISDQVMRMPQPKLQRGCSCEGGCPGCQTKPPSRERQRLRTKRVVSGNLWQGPAEAPPIVRAVLRSPGRPLDLATRAFMESRFERDFSEVRVHTDPQAQRSAQAVQAQAYTVGRDIVFGAGQDDPATHSGRSLLAHELTHVLQQRAGAPALQRRAANCPASPPSPSTINTMADFIALVRRVEASTMTGGDPIATARLISRTKYEGRAWDWMLPSTKGQPGVQQDPHGVGQVTAADVASLCFKLIVTVPGGGQEDPMHVIAAIVAEAETQAAGTGAKGFSRLVSPLPASVSQRGASTWVGDLGKAAAYWMVDFPLPGGGSTMADYLQEDAPPHDLMADVDGVAMTATSNAGNLAPFDRSKPLSENLQRFFTPAPRSGRNRRFHLFCGVEGLTLEADGVTLSVAARKTIREQVRFFAGWLLKNDPTLVGHLSQWIPMYTIQLTRRIGDWQWFADQFISFVETHLTAEGP